MLFLIFLSIIATIRGEISNQTTSVTVHIGDNGYNHYRDSDILMSEGITVVFFIVIFIACVGGFWSTDEKRHILMARPIV